MNTRNLARISTVTLGTALLTAAILHSGPMEAGNKADPLAATIDTPKLTANEIELSLTAAEGQVFKAFDEPSFVLQAINTSRQSKTMRVHMQMTATAPQDSMSRVMIMPTQLWQQDLDLELQPQETKQIPVHAQVKLPAGRLVSVRLQEIAAAPGQPTKPQLELFPGGIVVMNFSTANPLSIP
jgi:hypothetical protein